MFINKISVFLLTIMFFLSGIDKILNFNNVSKNLQIKISEKLFLNLPLFFSKIAIVFVILLEIIAPLIINYSKYIEINKKYYLYARYSSYLLALFTFFATYLYHFPPFKSQYYPFMSNITTIGGLILLGEYFDYLSK